MKRILLALLTLTMCLALTTASAVTLEELGDYTNVELIYNGSLMVQGTERGGRLIDMSGNPVTDAYYANVSAEDGYYTVVPYASEIDLNSTGLITEGGAEVMPCAYGQIDVLSPDWALGMVLESATADKYDFKSFMDNDAYFLIDTVDVYNLASGQKVLSLTRAEFNDADVVNDCINIENRTTGEITTYDAQGNALGQVEYTFDEDFAPPKYETFEENGREGVRDREGNVILEPSFYMIYSFDEGYAQVSTGDKEGLIDVHGNVVVPAEYDEVKRCYDLPFNPEYGSSYGYNAGGYFGVVKDGKLGFVKAGGEVTCEPKIAEGVMDFNGASATYSDLGGDMHILAADGVDTVLPKYDSLYDADFSAGRLYEVTNEDYDKGLIDWHGNEVLPMVYGGVDFSSDGKYVLAEVDWGEYKLFAIHYDENEMAAAPAAAKNPAPAANSLQAAVAAKMNKPQTQPAEQPEASGDHSAVITLVDSAVSLLGKDGEAACGLLKSVQLLLEEDHPAVGMINSAVTLLETDPNGNATAAKLLLESARGLL